MLISKKFYNMSGLKINEDKTKALWIGAMCHSEKKMCKEYNLDWEQKPLKILGVTFTGEVFDILNHNLDETLHKVNSLINVWSKRRLTIPGKITVIKQLYKIFDFIKIYTLISGSSKSSRRIPKTSKEKTI